MLWILIAVGLVAANRFAGGVTVDNFDVPGVESQVAVELMQERFPDRAGATAMVVLHSPDGRVDDPASAGAIDEVIQRVRVLDHVTSVTDPIATPMSISSDGRTAFAAVQYDRTTAELGSGALEDLVSTAGPAEEVGIQVDYGGELPTVLKERDTGPAEMIGVLAALVILFVTFRSLVAAALSPAVAALGLLVGLSLIGLLGAVIDVPSVAPRLGMMIGLGVGIDYALFVLSRHRDNLGAGMSMEESIGMTNATAGQAVVVAGGTVVVAILGLQMAGIPFVAALGYSASMVVAVAVLVAVTLLPALLAAVGTRITARGRLGVDATDERVEGGGVVARSGNGPHDDDRSVAVAEHRTGWVRWADWVSHHPWRSGIAATLVLLLLGAPVLGMRLGQADAGSDPTTTTHRRAYDLLAEGFGDGFNGPLLVVVDLDGTAGVDDAGGSGDATGTDGATGAVAVRDGTGAAPEVGRRIFDAIRSDPGVEVVSPPVMNDRGDAALMTVIPRTKPQDVATSDLVHRLRDDVLPTAVDGSGATAVVGGPTARFIDQSDKIATRLPWFIGAVVGLSFVLLMIVFRSILVPLKAALLNLLSIGAAYGVVVAVFQWGWGRSLIGLEETVPIAAFVPMMMFAILFGLSMDYEVFILSRIREEYHAGHSNIDSVVVGLGATAKVITAAALIMISVFLGFVNSGDPVVKMMGVGLATAVAVDATIVRMVLVPSTMALVGDANWWLPKWLDRALPHLDLE